MEQLTGRMDMVPNSNDYEKMTNKPSINGVELSGNKTSEELGLGSGGSDPVGDFVTREELQEMLNGFVDSETLIQELEKKADAETVNIELGKKADAETVVNALEGKVDTVEGKGLSSNDFTDEEKKKLLGIEDGAQVNPVIPEIPEVPSKVSDLQNDSEFQTKTQMDNAISEVTKKIPDVRQMQTDLQNLQNKVNGLVDGNEVAY